MKSRTRRHQLILEQLYATGQVNVSDLSKELNVSEVTIRKDLKLLEEKSLLFRTHGGGSKSNPYASDRPLSEKASLKTEEKNSIAVFAATLIGDNDSIIIASGTTMLALARCLNASNHLTVITPALNVALELSGRSNIDVLQLGGQVRTSSSSVTGPYAEKVLEDVSCGILFLGVDGIDLEIGLSTTSLMEARLNQKMMQAAQITVVLADSSKFGKRGLGKICAIEQVQHIITDEGISPALVKALENKGISVTVISR